MMCFRFAFISIAFLTANAFAVEQTPGEFKAIEKIQRMGGVIERDVKLPDHPVVSIHFPEVDKFKGGFSHLLQDFSNLKSLVLLKVHGQKPSVSDTDIVDLTADDVRHLQSVTALTFANVTIDAPLLGKISQLETLRSLSLTYSITDTHLREISKLKNLTSLSLTSSPSAISDTGLQEICKIQNLTSLDLKESIITDVGLREIGKLKNLTFLDLSASKITDEGLKELRHLQSLAELFLSETHITDEGLKEFRYHSNLRKLDLRSTMISDKGLKEVGQLKQLTFLRLDHNDISDDGLKELRDLTQLRQLGLGNHLDQLGLENTTKTTDAGVKELLDKLPDLEIIQTVRQR